jgi:hypothetical protein
MVANTGEILHPSTSYEDDAMFLQVMSFTADICDYFLPVR